MAFQPQIAATLVLIQADLTLVVLEASFHAPPREGHQQQGRYSGFRRCVAHEEFDLGGLQDIAGHHQVEPLSGQAVGVFDRDHDVLTFPHHWPLLAVLDMEPLPGPIAQPWVAQHPVDPLGRWTTAGQSGHLPAPTAAMATIGPVDNPRRVEPAREAPRHLADVPLAVARQCPQELRLAAIALVERQPLETDAAGDSPVVQLQGDLPFGPVDQIVGDARLTAPVAVGVPQLSGRYRSPSSRQWKSPLAKPRWTVTMQFSVLPKRPHHCFWTPGVLSPFLGSLVSSMIPMVCGPACSVATIRRSRSRIKPSSHLSWLRNSWRVRGATPASRAIGSTLFWGRSESCPRTYVPRWARVSLRLKQSLNWSRNRSSSGSSRRIC